MDDLRPFDPDLVRTVDVGGIAPIDIKEDFPAMAGDGPVPDAFSKPDTCPKPHDVEEDFPIPGGIGVEPDSGGTEPETDVKGEVDAEEWPLDGDMEWPEE